MWKVVINSNLNSTLKLFFFSPILTNNNLLLKIYCENILVKFLNQDFLFFHFILLHTRVLYPPSFISFSPPEPSSNISFATLFLKKKKKKLLFSSEKRERQRQRERRKTGRDRLGPPPHASPPPLQHLHHQVVGNFNKKFQPVRNKTNRENTRQRKQSHAQDNIYVVRQFAYVHGVAGISL